MSRFWSKSSSPSKGDKNKQIAIIGGLGHGTSFTDLWSAATAPVEEPELTTLIYTWYVNLNLEIITSTPLRSLRDVYNLMGVICDSYEGPLLLRPIILGLYALAGVFSNPVQESSNRYKYQANMNQLLSFFSKNPNMGQAQCDMKWYKQTGTVDNRCSIRFNLSMVTSRRKGVDLFAGYIALQQTDPSLPSLDTIIEEFLIQGVEREGQRVIFL
uniref:Matrix protein n=1 Tax=Hymenopteran rhabdo-related virus OKIAV8 TaxID=2746296 RepID=A0A7D7EY36_9RHAB|nr:matrix protein [Hymenopteran rhabdo-related virus OKIAV8]